VKVFGTDYITKHISDISVGASLQIFINVLEYDIRILQNNIQLFSQYLDFYHKSQTRYLDQIYQGLCDFSDNLDRTEGGMREDEVRTHPNECIRTSSSHTGSDDEFEKNLQLDEVPEPSCIIPEVGDLVSEASETDINKSVPYLENIYLQDKREPSCKLSEKTSQYYKNKSKK